MSFQKDCLKGKVALITGGGTGICKGIAHVFMRHGCKTIITSRKIENLRKTAEELSQAYGIECFPVAADVRDVAVVENAVDEGLKKFGKIDILVNGAAGNFLTPAEKLSSNGFKTVLEIDTLGTFNVSQIVFKKCFKQHGGVILNISATLHYNGTLLQVHAGSAKAAIDAMTKHLAVEWGPYNVRVVGIAPGPIAGTEGMSRLDPSLSPSGNSEKPRDAKEDAERKKTAGVSFLKYLPIARLGTTEDIGNTCLFFALKEASYITGVTVCVDGGQSLTVPNFTILDPNIVEKWARCKL